MEPNFIYKNNVYWKVKDKIFHNKFDALLEATNSKSNVTFHYYDSVFDNVDKSLLGKNSLDYLYKLRAQQLRDEYDYLILYFSGGSDSYNILRTFLDNNIKLDEVCIKWPKVVIDKKLYTPNTKDKTAFNYLSEWDYAIKPVLDKLKITNPEIKIEIADWSDFKSEDYNEEKFRLANAWNDVEVGFTLANSLNEVIYINKGKRVASIYGIDKPLVALINGNWVSSFLDTSIGLGAPLEHNQNSIEYFYWTPKMPILCLEQAHKVCTYVDTHVEIQKFFYTEDYLNWSVDQKRLALQIQNDIIKSVIYTTWDYKFQTDKPVRSDRTDKQSWLFSHPELSRHRESFIDFNSLMLSQLDPQFVSEETEGYQVKGKIRGLFKFCKSKWHFIKKQNAY